MEDVDKNPEEASKPSELSGKQEAKEGVSTREADEDPRAEVHEEAWESLPQEEEDSEMLERQSQRMEKRQMFEAAKLKVLEREHQQVQGTNMVTKPKQIKGKYEEKVHTFNKAQLKKRAVSDIFVFKNLKSTSQMKQLKKSQCVLLEGNQKNERLEKKIKHIAHADARKFKEMWLTVEEEVKQLVERALLMDSLICKEHLGIDWEPPPMAFMDHSGPIQPQTQTRRPGHQAVSQLCQTGKASQCSTEMCKEGRAVQIESDAEMEEEKLSMETLKQVMELLCDESGFLMEVKLLKLLAPLEEDEQTVVKLGSLLCSCGIGDKDVPKLAHFLLMHKLQQRDLESLTNKIIDVCGEPGQSSEQAEAVETSSTSSLTSDLNDPNHVLPALKSFLKQHMRSRESSGHQQTSSLRVEARDRSEDKAYWESMGNIISEDKIKLWDAAESSLKQYLSILTDISELVPETESLRQQNTELKMLLQKSLNPSGGEQRTG
ncbi:dynein regulatory complex protein 1-like [Toxotes jaculatrix]|uniref:dynein regulatory complex protein 1-like n=1 Tax=Toxotes jaculatrix TaxID=941984 RepID=UPI001B3AD737|nr:dynein regulatory complex protein 1-like [Toxotes jaculatrix]